MAANDYDYLYKILLIGNSAVGKSSLLLRFVDSTWNDAFVPTIGVDFKVRTMNIDGKKVKLQIWDTAGQERFKNITSSYYRGAHGIMVVYDITDMESFNNVSNWLIEIEKNAKKNAYKILIGNKNDLEDKRVVSKTQGQDFANTYGMNFLETSAKSNTAVDEAFEKLALEYGLVVATPNYEGVRVSSKNGWMLLRLSLHEPLLPLNIEGNGFGDVEKLTKIAFNILSTCDNLDMKGLYYRGLLDNNRELEEKLTEKSRDFDELQSFIFCLNSSETEYGDSHL